MSRTQIAGRWYQKVVLLLVALFVVYVVAAPLVVATWGKKKVTAQIAALTGHDAKLASLYFNPFTNRLSANGFALSDKDGDVIRFGNLSVDLELAPLLSHQIYFRDVTLSQPYVRLVRLEDGKSVNLQQLVKPTPAAPTTATTTQPQAASSLTLVIANLEVGAGQVDVRDRSLTGTPQLLVGPINFRAHDIELTANRGFAFQLAVGLPNDGHITVDGKLTPEPLALQADIVLAHVALALANPWFAANLRGQLVNGLLDSKLHLSLVGNVAQVTGAAQVGQLQVNAEDSSPLLTFDDLTLDGLTLDSGKHEVNLDAITLTGLSSHFALFGDGSTSVSRLLPAKQQATKAKSELAATDKSQSATAWRVQVQKMQVNAKELVFVDQSVKPVYHLKATPLQLAFGPLDTGSDTPAVLDMTAKLGGYAALSVQGKVAAFGKRMNVDLHTRLNGYDMTDLTPYTGKFVGYQVQKGQLGVTSQMQLDGNKLSSHNTIDADNFYLGKSVPSKQAITAPVKIGLAVLRDTKGDINLPLDVAGDLADPSVSVSGLILKAILNVLAKAATAPLSVLSLLSGGVDLQQVTFAPGEQNPDVNALAPMAKVLTQRPELLLGLSGHTGAADAAALTGKGIAGEALQQGLQQLADARAKALKLALVEHYAVAANRLYLEQPQADGKLVGVALSAINK